MAKRFRVPENIIGPPKKPERLGSPALYAQRKLMSETGQAETRRVSASARPMQRNFTKRKGRRKTAVGEKRGQ